MKKKINLKQLRADLGSNGAKTNYVEMSYSFNRASDVNGFNWRQLNSRLSNLSKQYSDTAADITKLLRASKTVHDGGYGSTVHAILTRDPDGTCALAKKIAKQLKMQVKCVASPVD